MEKIEKKKQNLTLKKVIEQNKSEFYDLISQNLKTISSKFFDYQNFLDIENEEEQDEEEELETKKDVHFEFLEFVFQFYLT